MVRKDVFISLTLSLILFNLSDVLGLETRSACSNDTLTLECLDNQRIGIKRVFYGAKKDRNCSTKGKSYSRGCCRREYEDCLVYNNDIQETLNSKCSGKASCQVPTPSVSTGDFCTDEARKTTDYMTVMYECIPDTNLIGLCSNEEKTGKVMYLSNNDYPVPIKGKNNCTCTAKTNSDYGIVVSIIDVLFPSSGRTCPRRMNIKDTSTDRGTEIGCGWPVYGFRTLYSSRTPNVTFNLITGEGDNNGYIWMELKPRIQSDLITLRCGDPSSSEVQPVTTMKPTTKTTTKATTTVPSTTKSTTTIAPMTTKADTMAPTTMPSTTLASTTTAADTKAPTTTSSTTLASTTTTAGTMAPNKTRASTMVPSTKQSTAQPTNASPSTKMTTKTMATEKSTAKQMTEKPKMSTTTANTKTTKTTPAPGDNAGKRGEQAVTTAKASGGEMTTDKMDEETAKQKSDECLIDYCYEISRPMSLIMVGSFPNTTFLNSVCKPLESSSNCLKAIKGPCEYSQRMVEYNQLEEDVEVLEQLRTIVCSDHRSDLEAFENCYSMKAKTEIAGCQPLSKPPMQSDGQPKMETEPEQCMRLQKLYKCIVKATTMCGENEAKAAETITKKVQAVISGQDTMTCPTSAATSFLCDNSWIFIAALMYIFLRL